MTLALPAGSGAQADVYREGDRAVKVYKAGHHLSEAEQEIALQRLAWQAGLPVAKPYRACEVNDRPAVVMEYLAGDTLGDELAREPSLAAALLSEAAALQHRVHRAQAGGFPGLREKLLWKLRHAPLLSDGQRARLSESASHMPDGHSLCHGDFHVYNLIRTPRGIRIIDWVDAACGPSEVDACRSYLLYLLHSSELGELYLDCYLHKTGAARAGILRWLPVLAAARLTEIARPGDNELLLTIIGDMPT